MKGYTITDIGKVRSENQDSVRFVQDDELQALGILVLCDGMGGAQAGSVASNIAMSAFIERSRQSLSEGRRAPKLVEILKDAAEYANTCVFSKGNSDAACEGMGTTLVAAVIKSRSCCVVNVGDSRAYLISKGEITQITRDHSFVEEMVSRGSITREQAKNHPRKNVITRAIGVEPSVECDLYTPPLKKNDILLLCSDGLSNTLSDAEILEIAERNKQLSDIGKELVDLALSRGAPDNVTVGLVRK
ncbi:MAG: Stp1/IreP family PP2C-type Ser/Thr phosphatase [Oscillospiraceae bacterium]|nr:Stp1/IreP family PP2C-type Ser/Thr phosphatase [Oscillospiraceae bacterium]